MSARTLQPRDLPRLPRPLTWLPNTKKRDGLIAWEGFDPGCGLDPTIAGRWTLGAVLVRMGARLVRAETIDDATKRSASDRRCA